jgi:hypothetical protein
MGNMDLEFELEALEMLPAEQETPGLQVIACTTSWLTIPVTTKSRTK